MSFYQSKPRRIEAFQWTGSPDQTEDPEWIVEAIRNGDVVFRENLDERCVEMRVMNVAGRWRYAKPGNWVIRMDEASYFEVLTDKVFRERYEAVPE